jgi:hypothetical protein
VALTDAACDLTWMRRYEKPSITSAAIELVAWWTSTGGPRTAEAFVCGIHFEQGRWGRGGLSRGCSRNGRALSLSPRAR